MVGREERGKMACRDRPATALTVSLVYLLTLFGSYCQMAPAVAGGAVKGWEIGSGLRYSFTTTVLFRESGQTIRPNGDVGFQLTGYLDVTAVWKDPNDPATVLLNIQLASPQLWIKSRKAPEPEMFVEHSSRVNEISEKPVLVLWKNGDVQALYADTSDSVSSLNIKRGFASIFQYKTMDEQLEERDASGTCNVTYTSTGPKSIIKTKEDCTLNNFSPAKRHPNPIFDVKVVSVRDTEYKFTQTLLPKIVTEGERHDTVLIARPEIGSSVASIRVLILEPDNLVAKTVDANSVKDAVILLQPGYREIDIELQPEPSVCPDSGCPMLEQMVEENREALDSAALGTAKSALAFVKLAPLVSVATPEELAKLLKSPRYRQLKPQLLDILGSVSTPAAHQAAMKILRQDEIGDDTERYLWALSMSPVPDANIAKDILKRSEETLQNDKVSETLALTAAAMARHHGSPVVIEKARVSLEIGLDSCTGEECKLKFLRALRNLRSKAAIPVLLKYALDDNRALSVAAWKALKALRPEHIISEVKDAATKVFYQIGGPRRDSSARTLALDIILESNPTKKDLYNLVEYLAGTDPAYEIRKYLSQRLEQLAEKDKRFAKELKEVFAELQRKVHNYNVLAQKGLSTAFTRNFLKSSRSNVSLVTVQEVNSGLLKRGIVDVVLETNEQANTMFSLGLFASGLGNFVSSNEDDNTDASDDEPATAGMEIDVLGVGVRPFVFFSGQGELMGHVWSGTASERTPAFQTLASLHSHSEVVPLASGFVVEMDIQGAMSFDLAGQIQLSLWSRNAQSLVEMGAGVAIIGGSKMRSSFVHSSTEFAMTVEPKLVLATDVDFSGAVSLCMRLSQPDSTVKQVIYQIERIPGSRHKLRKTRRMTLHIPAKSYLLNQKNNEMCSKVFS